MRGGLPKKARLVKRLTTKQSPERIELALAVLSATPQRLRNLRAGLTEAKLTAPLGAGERSFKRDLTHLIYCAERGEYRIVHALLLEQPQLPRIHAERDWGKLMRYEAFPIAELLDYFGFRRRALLRILRGLQPEGWQRSVHRAGVKRSESVYYAARGLCLHEVDHLEDLAKKLGVALSP